MRQSILQGRMIFMKQVLFASGVILMLGACIPDVGVDLNPSAAAQARGYPALMPMSFFNMEAVKPVDPANLIGRVASLRRKIAALNRPVIPRNDRLRLEAALLRHAYKS
ncbi:MAG: hypothetical protein V3V13_13640 [Paracoccaceae bacterium]